MKTYKLILIPFLLVMVAVGGVLAYNRWDMNHTVPGAGTLPIRNNIRVRKFSETIMEYIGLQIYVGSFLEIRQHNDMKQVRGSKSIFSTNIKQVGNFRHAGHIHAHFIGREPDKFGFRDSLFRR